MTIVVGVAAPDGMILAADSRTTYTVGERHRIASDNAQKVFPICGTIGVATYGDAGIGARTIAGLMDEFVSALDDAPGDANAIAQRLGEFFDARYRAETPPEVVAQFEESGVFSLGFLIAGYDEDGIGRIREVSIPGPVKASDEQTMNTATRGVSWRGQTDVIRRLLNGWDVDLFYGTGNTLPDDLAGAMESLQYQLLFPITMQDAVDMATFLIRTTVEMQRFSDGTNARPGELPACGGPLRVLSVTRDRASWVAAPALSVDASPTPLGEGGFRRP